MLVAAREKARVEAWVAAKVKEKEVGEEVRAAVGGEAAERGAVREAARVGKEKAPDPVVEAMEVAPEGVTEEAGREEVVTEVAEVAEEEMAAGATVAVVMEVAAAVAV